jgi:hypothetical protein
VTNPKGTFWETQCVKYLRERGISDADRIPRSGAKDRGDIKSIPGVTIEAKNWHTYQFAKWLQEAAIEAAHAGSWLPVVWAHRNGKGSPADGFVVMSGAHFAGLLLVLEQLQGNS